MDKQIQELMRHASITTTMNIYGRLLPNELVETTASIGPMFASSCEAIAELKTGTDEQGTRKSRDLHVLSAQIADLPPVSRTNRNGNSSRLRLAPRRNV